MSSKLAEHGLDVEDTVEKWKKEGLDETTIVSRIFSKYVESLKNELIGMGCTDLESELNKATLVKNVKENVLNG